MLSDTVADEGRSTAPMSAALERHGHGVRDWHVRSFADVRCSVAIEGEADVHRTSAVACEDRLPFFAKSPNFLSAAGRNESVLFELCQSTRARGGFRADRR